MFVCLGVVVSSHLTSLSRVFSIRVMMGRTAIFTALILMITFALSPRRRIVPQTNCITCIAVRTGAVMECRRPLVVVLCAFTLSLSMISLAATPAVYLLLLAKVLSMFIIVPVGRLEP